MSDDPKGEDAFFEGAGPAPAEALPPRRPRRESALLARSPVFAAVTAFLAGWLLASLWPDVAYFFSPATPIDLGAPGAYHLDAARENRLVQIRGPIEAPEIVHIRQGAVRAIGRIAGTNVFVDHPGRSGIGVYEGRLLPRGRRQDYAAAVEAGRPRGAPAGDAWGVLRDGERPRQAWLPVVGSALLLVVLAINLRALVRALVPARRERR